MKALSCGLLVTSLILSACSFSQAGSVYFAGDVGKTSKSTGIIQVLVDVEPGHTMRHGNIVMDIANDNPSAFIFTDADVANPANPTKRWSVIYGVTTSDYIEYLAGISVLSPGVPAGGQGVLFATINWQRSGVGRSNLTFIFAEDSFVDGPPGGSVAVTDQYTAVNNFLEFVPEPSSLFLGSLGLVVLALRLRNG